MASTETAICIELIEERGIVMAPAVVVERRRSCQEAGKVDRHGAVFRIKLDCSG